MSKIVGVLVLVVVVIAFFMFSGSDEPVSEGGAPAEATTEAAPEPTGEAAEGGATDQ